MELEVYTTGGGEFLTTTFNAIAAFCNTGDFAAMINIGLLVGLIVVLFQLIMGGAIMDVIKMYVVVAFVGALSIGPKADVIIFDKTQGSLPVGAVGNVPLSVAYVGHITSSFGEVLTRRMETLLAPPTSISYQNSGMLFGATLRARSARWHAVSSVVHENAVNFLDQCMIDAVSLRYVTPGAIAQSGDLGSSIAAEMPSSLAYYDVVTESTRLCSEGWPDIELAIEQDVEKVIGRQAAAIYQVPTDTTGTAGPAAINRLKQQISDFASFSGIAAADAVENIKQSMLIAALDDAATRSITSSTNAAALEHLQAARTEAQTRSSYGAVATQALSWVPYLKIVFENLYYGAFPIALFMMMTPYALTVLRGYFGGFVWLASWEPLSAILHSIVLSTAANKYRLVTTSTTDGVSDAAVVSWANHFGVFSVQQDVASLAGYLMMSIPFIASVLFFGANRMVGLATSTLAVSQSAATETGREIATGNFNYGNASVGNSTFDNFSRGNYNRGNYAANNRSWNNVNANRHSTSSYDDHGRSTVIGPNGAEIIRNQDGSVAVNSGSSISRTATTVGLGQNVVSNLETRASQSLEKAGQHRVAAERSSSQIENQTSSFMQAVSGGRTFTKSDGTNQTYDEKQSVSDSISTVDRFAETRGITRETALSLGVAANAKTPSWYRLSASAKADLSRRGVTADNFQSTIEAARTANVDKAVSQLHGSFNSLSQTEQDSLTRTSDRGMRTSIDDVERHTRAAEASEREAQAYTNAASRAESRFVDGKVDLSQAFVDYLVEGRGYSPSQASDILSGRKEFQDLNQQLRDDFSSEYIADIVAPEMSEFISKPLPETVPSPAATDPQFTKGDYLAGGMPGYAQNSLDVQTGIIQGRVGQENIGGQAAEQRQQYEAQKNRNEDVSTLSSRIHDSTKGNPAPADKTEGSFKLGADGQVLFGSASHALPLTQSDRDAAIRTIYGEAAGESADGQAAVAHVIRNRVEDPRFDSTAGEVVFAPKQFSAWNADSSGNSLPSSLSANSEEYKRIGEIVDRVFAGDEADTTGGATHYYSPAGMQDLVQSGYQSNQEPTWLAQTTEERAEPNVQIGNHIFSGRSH